MGRFLLTSYQQGRRAQGSMFKRKGLRHLHILSFFQNYYIFDSFGKNSRQVLKKNTTLEDEKNTQMHLRPFTLRETELYLESRRFKWDRLSVMQAYMALGGIPYYLGLLHRDESFAMNIDRLFFSEELGHLPTDRLLFAVLPDICTQGRSGNGLLEQPYRDARGKHLARFEFRAPVYDPYLTNQAGNAP